MTGALSPFATAIALVAALDALAALSRILLCEARKEESADPDMEVRDAVAVVDAPDNKVDAASASEEDGMVEVVTETARSGGRVDDILHRCYGC